MCWPVELVKLTGQVTVVEFKVATEPVLKVVGVVASNKSSIGSIGGKSSRSSRIARVLGKEGLDSSWAHSRTMPYISNAFYYFSYLL